MSYVYAPNDLRHAKHFLKPPCSFSLQGTSISLSINVYTIPLQNTYTNFLAVALCSPNWFATTRYSTQLASLYRTMAALIWSGIGPCTVTSWGLKTHSISPKFIEGSVSHSKIVSPSVLRTRIQQERGVRVIMYERKKKDLC